MASDTFTDSDGTALESHDANWTSVNATYPVTNCEINGNVCEHEAAWRRSGAYYAGSSEDTSEIVFVGGVSTLKRSVAVRMGADQRGYGVVPDVVVGANFTRVSVAANGVWHDSTNTGDYAWASDHTVRITVSGSDPVEIAVTIDGDAITIDDDTTSLIGAGSPGFWIGEAGTVADSRFDDWTDGAGAPATNAPTGHFYGSLVGSLGGPI